MTRADEPRLELKALTGIRGVAAWFVVLYHIRLAAPAEVPDWLIGVFAKGYLAVDLFFMLSGFVLWLAHSRRLREEGPGSARQFIARRIARIWPLHLFVLALTMAFAAIVMLSGRPATGQYPWSELPLHIFLLQNWGFTGGLSWNDPAWSISCEFTAYLLFPILASIADWRRLDTLILLAIIAALAVGLHMAMSWGGAVTLGDDIPRFGLVRALAEFTIGTIVCELWSRSRAKAGWAFLLAFLVASILAWAVLTGKAAETIAVPLLFASSLLMLAHSGAGRSNPFGWRPIHYLGEISYATYLLHFMLFVFFKLAFVEDPKNVPLPLLASFLGLTLAGSVLLHHVVERPAQRFLNRLYDRRFGSKAGPARPAAALRQPFPPSL